MVIRLEWLTIAHHWQFDVSGTYRGKFSLKLAGKPYQVVRFRRAGLMGNMTGVFTPFAVSEAMSA